MLLTLRHQSHRGAHRPQAQKERRDTVKCLTLPSSTARGLNLWYGPNHALKDISVAVPAHEHHGAHRAVRLRQVDLPQDAQPHERPRPRREDHGRACAIDGEDIYAPAHGCDAGCAAAIGMVFQKAEPLPHEHLRQHRLRPAHARRAQPREARRDRGALAALRRHLGRGEGPAQKECARPLRRTAAAALHRPRARRRAGGAAHGRVRRARSTPSPRRRSRTSPCELKEPLHRRHGHAQYAAGGAHFGQHRLLPARRAGGVRRDGAGLLHARATSGRRTTSQGGLADAKQI